jgi:hypothetical protein
MISSSNVGVLVGAILIAAGSTPAFAACDDSRGAWSSLPTLETAGTHIACLEESIVASGPAQGWRPQPFTGTGPKPGSPTYRELEEYLQWLRQQYEFDEAVWTGAMAQNLPDTQIVIERWRVEQVAPNLLIERFNPEPIVDFNENQIVDTPDFAPSLDSGGMSFSGGGM